MIIKIGKYVRTDLEFILMNDISGNFYLESLISI